MMAVDLLSTTSTSSHGTSSTLVPVVNASRKLIRFVAVPIATNLQRYPTGTSFKYSLEQYRRRK